MQMARLQCNLQHDALKIVDILTVLMRQFVRRHRFYCHLRCSALLLLPLLAKYIHTYIRMYIVCVCAASGA